MYIPSEKKKYKCYKYKELILYYNWLKKKTEPLMFKWFSSQKNYNRLIIVWESISLPIKSAIILKNDS